MPVIALDREVSGLLNRFDSPQRLVDRTSAANVTPHGLVQLVLSGALLVEGDNGFVCGPSAVRLLGLAPRPVPERPTIVWKHSFNAIRLVAHLPINDPSQLAARLYFFNRLPVQPQGVGDDVPSTIKKALFDWSSRSGSRAGFRMRNEPHDGWWYVLREEPAKVDKPSIEASNGTYKCYIGVRAADLLSRLQLLLDAIAATDAPAFKIASNRYGIARADKFIVYGRTEKALRQIVDSLHPVVSDIERTQPVPFTSAALDNGSVSWAYDPPIDRFTLSWLDRESWRVWICNRIAVSLQLAKLDKAMEPWQFAMLRLEWDGIDTLHWRLRDQASALR
ncbi:MAG: hypothetical protein JNL18_18575 [Planctomycetaceae bacterium]|nr:hypothetical protein [Planctomycetaceae bacterium]